MTRLEIDAVLERVRTWPEERQEDAAAMLLMVEEQDAGIYMLDAEEERALDEAEASGVASDEEVEALFARYRR